MMQRKLFVSASIVAILLGFLWLFFQSHACGQVAER